MEGQIGIISKATNEPILSFKIGEDDPVQTIKALSKKLTGKEALLAKTEIVLDETAKKFLLGSQAFRQILPFPFMNLPHQYIGKELPDDLSRIKEILKMLVVASPGINSLYDDSFNHSKKSLPAISIIMITWNKWEFTKRCLKSLLEKTDYPNYELIIIDNGSTDFTLRGLASLAKKYPNLLKIIRNRRNIGFSFANNQGAEASRGEHLLFLNNDTEIYDPNWLKIMARTLDSHYRIGACGQFCALNTSDEDDSSIQGVYVPGLIIPISWVAGHCLMIKRGAFNQAGGWPWNLYKIIGCEDIHICYALREKGFMVTSTPSWLDLAHFGGKTRRQQKEYDSFKQDEENFKVLYQQWGQTRRIINCALSNRTLGGLWDREKSCFCK